MCSSSAGVARRFWNPMTAARTCVAPTKVAMLRVEPVRARWAK